MKSMNSSIVQRLTIAALLGTLPAIAEAQQARLMDQSTERTPGEGATEDIATDSIRVAARPIARGAVLTAEDIAYEARINPAGRATPHSVALIEMDRHAATPTDAMVGWTARRVISTGEPLRAPAVISPRIIASGQAVDVIWKSGTVIVTAKGHATRAAGAGERLAVRLDAQRVVEGLVIAPGRVRVD